MLKLKRNNGLNNSSLTLEASAERERVKKFMNDNLGKDYFDKYLNVRDRLTDPNMKDFNKIIKLDPEDVKVAIDRYNTTPTGKKTVGENSDWIVYHVTDFSDAQELGEGSEWCITGRYPNTDPDDPHYFNDYISKYNLDGGYYFYIPKDGGNDKFCLLLTKNGDINSIWATPNHKLRSEDLEDLNFPTVRGINLDDYYYDGYEGYDNNLLDNLYACLEEAYYNDDFDVWLDCAHAIEEAGGYVDYPSFLKLFYDDKPDLFGGIAETGLYLDEDDKKEILDDLFLFFHRDYDDWKDSLVTYLNAKDIIECIKRMSNMGYEGLEDILCFGDFLDFEDFIEHMDLDELISLLNREEFTKKALDAVTDVYLEPKIIGILDDVLAGVGFVDLLKQGGHIVDLLKVLNKKGINVKPAFEEGRTLNLASLLLDEDYDLSDIEGEMIEGLINLGAKIKPDEIKALKERIDSLDEDDRRNIDQEILDLVK